MKSKNYFVYGFLLLAVCVISGAALSFVSNVTAPAIKNTERENLIRLQKEVLPEADLFEDAGEDVKQGFAGKDKIPVGKVVLGSARGYGGDVNVIVGINRKSEITAVKVLSHKETPGLGTKALTYEFLKQFVSKKSDEIKLKKDDPAKGAIDGITGATITSRAVTKAVADALLKAAKISSAADSTTSATPGNYRIKRSSGSVAK